ncbi:MAG TPA: GNAT family N-acetyltransferase, partial [Tepidisphaeraceae bacterium]|nr:GNAT family N-acetyltransferase [Tepidisphaeraceae bacterium]
FTYMWRYTYNLRGLYETPALPKDEDGNTPDRAKANQILEAVRKTGRTILTENESKDLLAAYRVPTVPTDVARSAADAIVKAERLGYPVVLKLYSETITHKTDVGGVKLNLIDRTAVEVAFGEIARSVTAHAGAAAFGGVTVQPMIKLADGYELIIGSSVDPQFGPVLLFGTGGQLVEVFKDRALALPPLNATLARRMMEQTKIFKALQGVRGRRSVDIAELEQILVRFSQLVAEQPWVKEIDINPLFASADRLVALDARVVLHDPATPQASLPTLAIRPYPSQYVQPWEGKRGLKVCVRPIRPEDEPLMVQFHQTLSERSVRFRYFQPLKLDLRTTHERLTRVCFNDYAREIALVVDHRNDATGRHEILGVGRLSKVPLRDEAEFAILISDEVQNRGLGTELLRRLVRIAKDERVAKVTAHILPDNVEMQRVCEKVGFKLTRSLEDSDVYAEIAP